MKTNFIFMTAVILTILPGCQTTSNIPPTMSLYGDQSDLIFRGIVRLLHTSTIDASDPESMGVVQVTEVIKSSDVLTDLVKRDITVLFRDIKTVHKGDDLILFTRLDHLGNEISVTELGRMAPDEKAYPTSELSKQATEMRQKAQDDSLKTLVRKAEVIVTGRVSRTALLNIPAGRDTEHDPMWTEAFLDVSQTLKGNSDKTLSFIYPGSTDVAWYRSPKFKEGDEGTFLLRMHPDTIGMKGRLALLHKSEWQTDKANVDAIKKYAKQ